jgi:hypothetical protein
MSRLTGVILVGLVFFVLAIIGAISIYNGLTGRSEAQVASAPNVPCGDGTWAFSQAECDRARQQAAQ